MDGKGELGLLGITLVLVGIGVFVMGSVDFIDRNVIDLPLGPVDGDIDAVTRGRSLGPLSGLLLALLGTVLVALSGSKDSGGEEVDGPGAGGGG